MLTKAHRPECDGQDHGFGAPCNAASTSHLDQALEALALAEGHLMNHVERTTGHAFVKGAADELRRIYIALEVFVEDRPA